MSNSLPAPSFAAARQRGFTLIELMVVLVIIGIGTTAISLKLAPDPARTLRLEALQLAQAFIVAQDQARLEGRPIVWRADGSGYRFERLDGPPPARDARRVDAFARDDTLHARTWRLPGTRVWPRPRLLLTSEWIGPGWQLRLSDGRATVDIVRDRSGRLSVR